MLNFSRPFRTRAALSGATMLLCSVAVADESFVNLNGVRIFFDGTEEQVEVLFDTDDLDRNFNLINAIDQLINLTAIRGTGENQAVVRPRTEYPSLLLNQPLRLKSLGMPVVTSAPILPTGEIVLHSVTIIGDDVEIIYSKGYSECVNLIDENDSILSIFAGTICDPGNQVSVRVNQFDNFADFSVGDEVRLRTPPRPDLTTNSVVVGGDQPITACVLSESTLSLKDRAAITSTAIYAEGDILMGYDARVTGLVQGAANANLLDRAKITGALELVGSKSGNGTVTGGIQEGFPVPFQSLSAENVADGGPDKTVNYDATLTLAPGSYGNVTVRDRGRLELSAAGSYRFSSLSFHYDSKLRADTGLGEFQVEVQNQFETKDRFKVEGAQGGTPDGSKLFFYTNDDAVSLGHDSVLRGSLTAPNAELVFKDRAAVHGCVRAQEISLGYDATISEN